MGIERDRFLTEMMGECWHPDFVGYPTICPICKKPELRDDFSTPEGFFKLWNWCKVQSWWIKFLIYLSGDYACNGFAIFTQFINPDAFADEIARYRGWKEGE